ncbi:hypothetical protein BGZ51_000012 [Haplosporangium sp. Z 767]|nr:hypothetical protein BGZ51_000012 [Haplosporangium sp. Z 767]KAF9196310.1 hypothetical protein BGZ50_001060 [Haplosporangium sp. Z 11]
MHTWSHTELATLTNEQIVAEIKWTEKIIYDTMKYARAPYDDWHLPLHQIKALDIVSSFINALNDMGQIKSSKGELGGPITLEHDLISETIDVWIEADGFGPVLE